MARAKGTFFEKSEELLGMVGNGDLQGKTVVDQPYAWNQHEGRWIDFMGRYGAKTIDSHPQGGGPPPSKFLENPLKERAGEFARRLGDHALEPGGLAGEMAAIQEDLCGEVKENAPRFSGRLGDSGSPSVYDDGALVYRRPPNATREEGGEPFEGVPEGYYD